MTSALKSPNSKWMVGAVLLIFVFALSFCVWRRSVSWQDAALIESAHDLVKASVPDPASLVILGQGDAKSYVRTPSAVNARIVCGWAARKDAPRKVRFFYVLFTKGFVTPHHHVFLQTRQGETSGTGAEAWCQR